MTTPSPATTVPESVFSDAFRAQASYPAILQEVNRSPYLVDLLTQLQARGDRVELETAQPRAAFFRSSDGDIHIRQGLLPAVDPVTGAASNPVYLQQFVSMLGHESGHAVIQDRSRTATSPDEARSLGLAGEGVAITTEYVVAKQLGGTMWSGHDVQNTLDATATAAGKSADIANRRTSDPASAWSAFDTAAGAQGAAYYGAKHPSTARHTTYDEYYAEDWAVRRTRDGATLHRNIDWDQVQSADISIVKRADGSYQLVGNGVPMDEGPHAGKRVDFTAEFDNRSRATGETSQTPRPAMEARSDAEQAAISWSKRLLGPELTARLESQFSPDRMDAVCAAVLSHCARHQATSGLPAQAYLSQDGQTLAFRHEPMQLTELNIAEAAQRSVADHLQSARSGHDPQPVPGQEARDTALEAPAR